MGQRKSKPCSITRPLVLIMISSAMYILIQTISPKVMAMKKHSNMDEYTLDDQRTRKRKNYVVQMTRDSDPFGNVENSVSYDTEPFEPNTNPDELSALMVDYANMIRNDVILLDNSVETRTRKRGNIKVEKHNAIADPPCSCEYSKEKADFGEHTFPRFVEIKNCSKVQQEKCVSPYVCKESIFYVMRRRDYTSQPSLVVPNELRHRWVSEIRPISVGCVCTNEYLVNQK